MVARTGTTLLLATLLTGIQVVGGHAQEPQASDAQPEGDVATATVQIDGRALFRVRGASSLPAQERADAIEAQIREFARNSAIAPNALVVVPRALGLSIRGGDQVVMTVAPADATLEAVRIDVLAELHRQRIVRAVEAYRAERDPQRLARGAGLSLLMTVVFVALVLANERMFRRLATLVERRTRARIEVAPLGPLRVVHGRQIWDLLSATVRSLHWLVSLVLIYFWLEFVLLQFPWTRPLGERLMGLIVDPLLTIGLGIRDFIPSLLFLIVLAAVTRYGLRVIRLYISAVERGTITFGNFDPEWAVPTYKIVRTLVIGLAAVMAYPYLPGAGTEALQGLSVFAGLLFSLGAAGAVGNIIVGYVNTYGRVFRVGDFIQIGEIRGEVTQAGLMTTRVRTLTNEQVTIPNGSFLTTSVVNYSALAASSGLMLNTEVGISYDVPWRQVHAMLEEAARRTPDVLDDPAPFVLQNRLGDFAVVYRLNIYVRRAQSMFRIKSRLHQHILDVFNEHGVQIMTPAYEGDPAAPKVVPPEKWFATPASPPGDAPKA